MKAAMVAIALVLASASANAQPTTGVSAIYHGDLVIKLARGRLDPQTGNARIKVGPWPFRLSQGSNGIFPDQEAILIKIDEDPGFYLPPGMLRPMRQGRSFVYRAKRGTTGPRAILRLRVDTQPDGTFMVRFKVRGLDLSPLEISYPYCAPLAVIIGDDDGFSGAVITRRSFRSSSISIPRACEDPGGWPWITE